MHIAARTYRDPNSQSFIHENLGGINTAVLSHEQANAVYGQLADVKRSALESVSGPEARRAAIDSHVSIGPRDKIGIAFAPKRKGNTAEPFIYGFVKLREHGGPTGTLPLLANTVLLEEIYVRGKVPQMLNRSFQNQGVAAAITCDALETIGDTTEISFASFKTLGEAADGTIADTLTRHGLLARSDQLSDPDRYGIVHKQDSPSGKSEVPRLVQLGYVVDMILARRPWLDYPQSAQLDLNVTQPARHE